MSVGGRGGADGTALVVTIQNQPGIHKLNITPQNRGLFCYRMPKTYPRKVKQKDSLQVNKEKTKIYTGGLRRDVPKFLQVR